MELKLWPLRSKKYIFYKYIYQNVLKFRKITATRLNNGPQPRFLKISKKFSIIISLLENF